MSGSGSTLFVAFPDRVQAVAAQGRLQALVPLTTRVLLARTADGMVASRVPIAEEGAPSAAPPANRG